VPGLRRRPFLRGSLELTPAGTLPGPEGAIHSAIYWCQADHRLSVFDVRGRLGIEMIDWEGQSQPLFKGNHMKNIELNRGT
jgi:hypothetical protein